MAENLVVTGIGLDTADLVRAIERAERRIQQMEDEVDRLSGTTRKAEASFDGLAKKAVQLAAAYGLFRGLEATAGFIFETNVEFEQLEARLISITGSVGQAEAAFDLITRFASSTPFEVQKLTEAFTQLSAVGLEPTQEMLRELGDFAAAMGADIADFTGAVTRAATGETEALKRFGVVAKSEGDKLQVTFRGVTREVSKDFGDVVDLFRTLSRENFAGAMERQMGTLAGAISNLKDSSALLAREIGKQGLNAEITDLVKVLDEAIKGGNDFAVTLGEALASGVSIGTEVLQAFLEHLNLILTALEILGGAAIGRGLAGLAARIGAATAAAGGLKAALTFFGGWPGLIITAAGALAGVLIPRLMDTGEEAREVARQVAAMTDSLRGLTQEQLMARWRATEGAQADLELGLAVLRQKAEQEKQQNRRPVYGANDQIIDWEEGKPSEETLAAIARAEEQWKVYDGVIGKVAAAYKDLSDAEKQAADAEAAAAAAALTEEQARRAKAIRSVVEGLQAEIYELQNGEKAAMLKELAVLGASEATRKEAAALWDKVEAERAAEKAREDAQRLAEDNRRAVEQTIEQLERERLELEMGADALLEREMRLRGATEQEIAHARALRQGNEALRRQREEEEAARDEATRKAEAEVDRLRGASEQMAGDIYDAFASVIQGTESVGEAFANMVTRILAELARLAAERYVIDPVADAIFAGLEGLFGGVGKGGGSGGGGAVDPAWGGFAAKGGPVDAGKLYVVGEQGPELFVPPGNGEIIPNHALRSSSGTSGGQTVVHQTVNFTVQAIDGRDAARFVREQKGEIARVMLEASRESRGFRSQLLGG